MLCKLPLIRQVSQTISNLKQKKRIQQLYLSMDQVFFLTYSKKNNFNIQDNSRLAIDFIRNKTHSTRC